MTNAAGQPVIADFVTAPALDDLDAAHIDGIAFYIEPGKRPSDDYLREANRRGKLMLPIMENTGHASAGGAALGTLQAEQAVPLLEHVGQVLGLTGPIPFANAESDYDADPAVVGPYYGAFHARAVQLGWPLIIDYAGGAVGRLVKQLGLAYAAWRTCSGSFRGSGDLSGEDMLQACKGTPGFIVIGKHGGGTWDADTNAIVNPDMGLHNMEAGMSQADVQAITTAVQNAVTQIIGHVDQKAGEVLTGVGLELTAGGQTVKDMVRSMLVGGYGETGGVQGDLRWLDKHVEAAVEKALAPVLEKLGASPPPAT